MALSFPPNPVIGQQYQAPNGFTYTWDGTRWNASSGTGGSGGGGGGGGASIIFSNGTIVTATATSIDFVGNAVTATSSGTAVTVSIQGTATTAALGLIKLGTGLTGLDDGTVTVDPSNLANWTDSYTIQNSTDSTSILTASGTRDNIDAVVQPKGAGANQATSDGDKRGQYATDWQKVPLTFNRVASGNYAVIGGGSGNKASALHAVIIGGNDNTADSDYSTVLGGRNGRTDGITGAVIIPGNAATIPVQAGIYMLSAETTDNNVVTLTTDGTGIPTATNQLTLKDNTAMYIRGTVVAKEFEKYRGEVWSWHFEGAIRRDVGSTTTDFSPAGLLPVINLTTGINTASNWLLTLDIDNTNGSLVVAARGGSAQRVRWSCRIDTTEVRDA